MSKLNKWYLGLTFSIMLICWGICVLCSLNGIVMSEYYILYVPWILGGLSPTIASYVTLKKNGEVKGFKDWLKIVFNFKRGSVLAYVAVIVFGILTFLPQSIIAGYENGAALYLLPLLMVAMLVGGGLEEAGWRLVLQPELEKKFNYTVSTVIVAVIWSLWHLPLFFIQGVSQYRTDYGIFCIGVFGLSFALASLRKITGGVALCVLFHCTSNALSSIFITKQSVLGSTVAAISTIALSYVVILLWKSKQRQRIPAIGSE
ncbi:MAG: CPBP family intramembrane metalloprotease [Propionibacteriaceae bacterium]|jgi:membrane protease YdiL (CAAX protease family)|nr:CPBP family intramembrane metalloprotease [Propionibacteriaceae bacterium]